MVASEEIKGFAIVLMCGIASSMFSALFATRAVFDFLVSKRILKDHLVMLRLVKSPNINWMSLRWGFFILSFLLITGGMFVFFTRDEQTNSKYDNEFIGGTSVQINLKDGTNYTRSDIENMIRAKGEEFKNPALAAAKVYSIGKTELQYEISTTETNSTAADVIFTQAGKETVETVTAAIEKAEQQSSGTLYLQPLGNHRRQPNFHRNHQPAQ